tara:strand:- start:488 stop:712 length:225 start_codon:yes stop_codon:yes gene_type:complete
MKYFLLIFILILTSCSLNKNSTYWNEYPAKESSKNKKSSIALNKTNDFKKMTFNEFKLFLKEYADKSKYPDIND